MKRPRMTAGLATFAGTLVLAAVGCREELTPEAKDYVEYGWELMAAGEDSAAVLEFKEGRDIDPKFADAYNGLGWVYGKLDTLEKSGEEFGVGVNLDDTTIVATELLAGLSFVDLAMGDFAEAVTHGRKAYVRTPDWVFRRDSTLSYQNVIVTVAVGHYSLGTFDSSLVWVQRLDAEFDADVSTRAGRSELAAKLEDLTSP